MNSIYRKLVIYFLALNLLAIGSVGVYSYYKEKEALLSRTFDQLISVRQEKKNRILVFFRQCVNDMKNSMLLPGTREIFHAAVSDRDNTSLMSPFLTEYLNNAGCYRRLIIIKDSTIAYSEALGEDKKPFSMDDRKTLHNLQDFLSGNHKIIMKEINLSGANTRPALMVCRNVFDKTGKRLGTLMLEIKQEAVNTIMFQKNPNIGLGKTGEVYLVGSDRLMRSNSRFLKNAIFKTNVKTRGVRRAFKGETGHAELSDYRNISVLSAYSPLDFSAIHWAILAEIDTKEAMIPIYSIRDNIIYLSLLIALVSAAIITFLSRKISEPIKKLKDETEKIASGEYGNTIAVEASDEIGTLTLSFNKMSVKLRTQANRLEEEKKLRLRSVLDTQEEERQRLSRELHDGLGPLLLTGKMKLESSLEAEKSVLKKTTLEVMNLFSKTVQEIRNISNNMMPAGLKEFGLSMALQNFCRQVMDNHPIKVYCHLELQKEHYEKTTEIYLFRIAQEAVNNVLKHAHAKEIHLTLEDIDNHLFFTLIDDGHGFDEKSPDLHHGNGLPNLKERVNLLNGYFELTTAPGKGTRIDIDIPLA